MEGEEKMVLFDQYCSTCKNELNDAGYYINPCEECLSTPLRVDSHKPLNYESKKKDG